MLCSIRSLLCATTLAAVCAFSPSLASAQSVVPDLEAQIRRRAAEVEDRLIAWRRDIHQHPELGEQETRTAGLPHVEYKRFDCRLAPFASRVNLGRRPQSMVWCRCV